MKIPDVVRSPSTLTPGRVAAWLSVAAVAGALAWTVGSSAWRRPVQAHPTIRVAAAADLALALPDIASAFTASTHIPVDLAFGSSGLLVRQIEMGAPFDAFASADVALVDRAISVGACRAEARAAYAQGRLSIWWRQGLAVEPPASLADLADPRFRHIAIANPESAPYGRAAREALTATQVWAAVEPRLVFGENVQQALQFAQSGNADVAIVARSLALRTPGGRLDVDASLHTPLLQGIAGCSHGTSPTGGEAFARFVVSPAGLAILARHGFAPAE